MIFLCNFLALVQIVPSLAPVKAPTNVVQEKSLISPLAAKSVIPKLLLIRKYARKTTAVGSIDRDKTLALLETEK